MRRITWQLGPDGKIHMSLTEVHRRVPIAMAHATGTPIRVLIAEDHRITLWGLERLIESTGTRMQVAGTATTCAQLLAHPALETADLVLANLDLAGEDTCPVLGEVVRRCPGPVVVLTGQQDVERHRAAVMQGVRGLLHKSLPAETVLLAMEKVHQGEVWLERGLLGEVLGQLTGRPTAPQNAEHQAIAQLTPRERQVIAAMAQGVGRKQLAVAEALGMSEHTLRNHLTTIYSKLGLRGRLALHLFATRHSLDQRPMPQKSEPLPATPAPTLRSA
ncbi:MAG: two-component system, NarL family, nitrate/nitrite response regulator NarL [Pseudomonadota bacterium]|nr:two-component system, NarL family, nitrate/nitrite response regulator NarL [Pseudomonadota bacterium]